MVTPNFWIDKTPKDPSQVASSQLTQSDRSVMATVTGTPESDPSVPAGMVEVTIPDSPEPPAVVPADGGITSLGARVLCKRDSTGRITSASTPTSLPAGAEPVAVGVTGEWLATLDATTATTSAQVEAAQETAGQAARDALASLEAASKAVTGTTGEYAVGSSETVPPTSGWSTTPPVRTPGAFIWVRTTVTYGDGNSTTASPVLLTGNTGSQGAQGEQGTPGQDGQPGADGVGVTSTTITYAASTSATTPPTSGWTSQVPTVPQGHYLWTRTVWTYTTGATETGYSVAYMPEDGNDGENGIAGKDGVGIASTTITYAVSSSGTSAPSSGWQAQPPAASPGQFMWTRTVWTYTDSTTETGYSVGKIGDTGPKGADGVAGADGVGLTGTALAYAVSTSGTSAPSSGWSSTVPTLVKGRYLWTRSVWTYSDGSSETGYSVAYVGTDGSSGTDGLPGKDGVGITGTAIAYAVSASGTTAPSSGWQSTPPAASAGQFMWTRTTWTYSDASTEVGYSVGKIGETGATGAAGKGITSTVVTYQASSSGTTVPTGTWTSSIPSVAANQYLWTRTVISYTDGTSTTGYSIGKMGATGADGAAGADGRGVQSTAVTYQASSSGTTVPTGSWSSSIPTVSAGQYLWTRTVITYTDATTSTSYAIGKMGEQGVKGDTGSTGATGTSVTSVTTYYRTVTKGAAAPAKPTASPAPSPWTTTEPAYQANTELYRTDRIVYSTGSFAYTDVSKVSAYTAAAQAITVANLVEAAAQGLVKASATNPGHYKGRIWLQLNAQGRMIGIKVSNGNAWSSYTIMADQILVPSSIGTISLANGAITGPKISATAIDGKTITGALIRTSADGQRVEIDSNGLHIYRVAADGTLVETIRLGVDGDADYLQIAGADGSTLATISDAGGASFASVDSGDSLTYQGTEMSSLLDARSSGIVAWGGGWPWSGQPEHTLNGDESLCDLTVDLDATRMYSFAVSFGWKSNNDSAAVETRLRMTSTTDGSTPPSPTGSTSVWGSRRFSGQKSGQSRHEQVVGWLFQPDTTGTYRILLSMAPAYVSTGATLAYTIAIPAIVIRDEGPALPQMTNPSLVIVPSGGSPSTPPAVKRYIKDYACTWSQNYTNTGAKTTSMSQYAVQGSGGGPARRSMLGFQSMVADLNGASINGLWVYGYFQHWWNNGGGTAVFGVHGSTSAPSAFGGSVGVFQRGRWPNPGGLYVPIPNHVWAGFKAGTYRGVSLCAPGDSIAAEYYGYMIPSRCKIRADFTK